MILAAEDIEGLIADAHETSGDMRTALGKANGPDKATLFASLGIAVSYDPTTRHAPVTCTPRVREMSCRRGDLTLEYTAAGAFRGKFKVPVT